MTPPTYTNRRYLDSLEKKVMVFDGAMGTSLQNLHLTAQDFGGEKLIGCNDFLVISHPQAVETVPADLRSCLAGQQHDSK